MRRKGAGGAMRIGAILTPGWLAVHLGMLVIVAAFLGLGWWQVSRARSGNLLSFGYAIEWPVFAGFVVWLWIVEVRKVLRATADGDAVDRGHQQTVDDQATSVGPRSTQPRRRNEAAYDDSGDPELAAYNHYLTWLNANPRATPADYPGVPEPPQPAAKTPAKESS